MSALKRTDGSPVTRSRRLAIRECGIAYRPRGPGRRSRRSSPREGKPRTWRRAAGDVMPTAARYARCVEPTLSWVSSEKSAYITGKRCDAKVSRTVWREADGKGLRQEYLAGGPPYPVPSWVLRRPVARAPHDDAPHARDMIGVANHRDVGTRNLRGENRGSRTLFTERKGHRTHANV